MVELVCIYEVLASPFRAIPAPLSYFNKPPLVNRVDLLLGYVDLHRWTQLAYLGKRLGRGEVAPVCPVELPLVVIALAPGGFSQATTPYTL